MYFSGLPSRRQANEDASPAKSEASEAPNETFVLIEKYGIISSFFQNWSV
jgi:hypothetical protein